MMAHSDERIVERSWETLALFVIVTLGGGVAIGLLTPVGEWYQGLQKPFFNPPGWLFGPVWSVLYVMIAVAGWRTWYDARSGAAMKLWIAQLVLNFLWMPVFFGLQSPAVALVIIAALFAAVLAFILATWRPDRTSALLFAPYLAWVAFAALLNLSIWWMN